MVNRVEQYEPIHHYPIVLLRDCQAAENCGEVSSSYGIRL